MEVWPCLSKFRLEDLDRCVLTPAWNSVGLGVRVEGWASTQGGTVDKKKHDPTGQLKRSKQNFGVGSGSIRGCSSLPCKNFCTHPRELLLVQALAMNPLANLFPEP